MYTFRLLLEKWLAIQTKKKRGKKRRCHNSGEATHSTAAFYAQKVYQAADKIVDIVEEGHMLSAPPPIYNGIDFLSKWVLLTT